MKTYSLEVSDHADADIDRSYLRLLRSSPDDAGRWQAGFEAALDSSESLPHRCPKARESGLYSNVVVRQRYFGKYRLVFHVIEAGADDEKGIVRALRILHGARSIEQADKDDA